MRLLCLLPIGENLDRFCGLTDMTVIYRAVSDEMVSWNTQNVDKHYANVPARLDAIMRENAFKLLPGLRERLASRTAKVQ